MASSLTWGARAMPPDAASAVTRIGVGSGLPRFASAGFVLAGNHEFDCSPLSLRLNSVCPGFEFALLRFSRTVWRREFGRSCVPRASNSSSNGNGRPGRSVHKSGQGLNLGFMDTEKSKSQNIEGSVVQDVGLEKFPESPPERRRQKRPSKRGDAHNKVSHVGNDGDDPYRINEDGRKVYLDEFDVMTLLDPPRFLRPLDPVFYNHAAMLWKKIGDIPQERRHRLLDLLQPRHITKMWELSGLRYDDSYLFEEDAAGMLPKPGVHEAGKPMVWDGRVNLVPWYLRLFSRFQKVFFLGRDNKVYGRVITDQPILRALLDKVAPFYFQVKQVDPVMATDEPCDLVLEYGNGQLHLHDSVPPGFANPVKHLPPFNNKACDYLRAVGPGVLVGQAWIEGKKLEEFPYRFGEFLLVQRYH